VVDSQGFSAVRLPRTTAYRILETLCGMAFAVRDPSDDRYRITLKVRSLSDGFNDESWIDTIAKPVLVKQAKDVTWPMTVATLHGTSMLSRTEIGKDPAADGGRDRSSVRLPLLTSSAGRLFLAMCGEEQRTTLLDILARSDHADDRLARDKSQINRILAEDRNNGWVIHDDPAASELSLAVPVLVRSRFLAAVTMEFTRTAMTPEQAVEKYLPHLKRMTADVAEAFENYQPSVAP